jgi:hypothetical protein
MKNLTLRLVLTLAAALALSACGHTAEGVYIGRRWFVQAPRSTCQFWGYLKKPGESWHRARLVIMDAQAGVSPPDLAPVAPGPPFYGEDHNCEYAVEGDFTGQRAYDPNSDLELPLFAARRFTLLNRNPGPLPGVGWPHANGVVPRP